MSHLAMREHSQIAVMPQKGCDRLVMKNGKCNIAHSNMKMGKRRRYLVDLFTTLVDMKWRYCLLIFFVIFFSSWLIFTFFWWSMSYAHGDYIRPVPPGFEPCLHNVDSFAATLLFSMETQITIGYGSRYPSDSCPVSVLLVLLQSYTNVIIQTLMTGVVLAKLTKSKHRAGALLFSRQAVVCRRDSRLVLLCRIGDSRRSHLINCSVRGVLVRQRRTAEGEQLQLEQQRIDICLAGGEDRLFLGWPLTVEHQIDDKSPFWNMSAKEFRSAQFELLVFMTGVVVSTGATSEARTSYLPSEILWGHRFAELGIGFNDSGEYVIDYSAFHTTCVIPDFAESSSGEPKADCALLAEGESLSDQQL